MSAAGVTSSRMIGPKIVVDVKVDPKFTKCAVKPLIHPWGYKAQNIPSLKSWNIFLLHILLKEL